MASGSVALKHQCSEACKKKVKSYNLCQGIGGKQTEIFAWPGWDSNQYDPCCQLARRPTL